MTGPMIRGFDDRGHVAWVRLEPSTKAKIERAMRRAKLNGITLKTQDFIVDTGGDPTLDGMCAQDWLDAMLSD